MKMSKKKVSRTLAFLSLAFFAITVPALSLHADTMAFEGAIQVEMLPREEGTAFRVRVPTITFEPSDGYADSDRLLLRLAEALNMFEGYSILVEDHAQDSPPYGWVRFPSINFGQEVGEPEGTGMVLRVMAGMMSRFEGHSVLVEGHADSGTLMTNLAEVLNRLGDYPMLFEGQAQDTPPDATTITLPSIVFDREVVDGDAPGAPEGMGAVLMAMAGIMNRFEGRSIIIEDPEPQPPPPGAALRLVVPPIIFGPDAGDFGRIDTELMENNDMILRRIAEILNRFGDYSVRIEGHANPTTPPGTALRDEEETGSPRILGLQPLSEERARTVLERLVSLGVDRARLSAFGMGGTRVIARYEDRDYWWQNRRVEFLLIRE